MDIFMRCTLCRDVLPVYKIGGGYTLANTGGAAVPCPQCAENKRKNENEKIISASEKKRGKAQNGKAEISV